MDMTPRATCRWHTYLLYIRAHYSYDSLISVLVKISMNLQTSIYNMSTKCRQKDPPVVLYTFKPFCYRNK